MGNYLRSLSQKATLVAAPDTWIEGKALQQLETTAQLQGMLQVAGMPDLHPGRGYPVGAAFFSIDCIYPALVGNDIGCGMTLWQTDIQNRQFKFDKAQKQLGSIDQPLNDMEKSRLCNAISSNAPGTIGGGNHFAELQQIDTLYDHAAAERLGLHAKCLQLLVHSGSRGLGEQILQAHIGEFGHQGLQNNQPAFASYLQQHDAALALARDNRHLIALRFLQRLRASGQQALDIFHNTITPAQIGPAKGWLHRKGAAPADQGAIVIPGSRGDYSYVVQPVTGQASEAALLSLAHGAGRKWMRSECKPRLQRFSVAQLKRSALGSRLICCNHDLVYEEAPQAYKSIDTVIHALEGAGLVTRIARLKPVLTYKTQRER
ncbi:RNA-splicing ligase RtcB [Saezia sanguinis]|uniref:3'-phosphate/5'-hydroxy nucleic acid ligase n=1 Tax=Saezia sanguinis TaxID=1965230 RepID=A0A433SHQ9_9BURK|nr:RNA ligase RtcB family protein [Saezia sanguinis]RUS68289.1 RNA-splicing ligase RtcB [Saezia sanguinis]